jgi:hypothetical protein
MKRPRGQVTVQQSTKRRRQTRDRNECCGPADADRERVWVRAASAAFVNCVKSPSSLMAMTPNVKVTTDRNRRVAARAGTGRP